MAQGLESTDRLLSGHLPVNTHTAGRPASSPNPHLPGGPQSSPKHSTSWSSHSPPAGGRAAGVQEHPVTSVTSASPRVNRRLFTYNESYLRPLPSLHSKGTSSNPIIILITMDCNLLFLLSHQTPSAYRAGAVLVISVPLAPPGDRAEGAFLQHTPSPFLASAPTCWPPEALGVKPGKSLSKEAPVGVIRPWLHTWTNTQPPVPSRCRGRSCNPRAHRHDGGKEGETPSPRRSHPQPLRALSGRPSDARKNPGVGFVFQR